MRTKRLAVVRICLAAVFPAAFLADYGSAAVMTTKLQGDTIVSWGQYIERAERPMAADRPTLAVPGEAPLLADLNPNGDNAGSDVPGGYIHNWIGAVRIANQSVNSVRAVLENYGEYSRIYAPRLKQASATKTDDNAAGRVYDVMLVSEQIESIAIHFAFNLRSHVQFRTVAGETRIDSRSYLIRESDSGKAPYLDLLPEGNDHGIVWRLNSYWRLRQLPDAVYAELQVISLSRKPFFGMRDQIKNRARNSLQTTLLQTKRQALR